MILAGNVGTRPGALSTATPKPVLDVGTRPFPAWPMCETLRSGSEDFLLLAAMATGISDASFRIGNIVYRAIADLSCQPAASMR
jgi:NDP-sugar pyrophosphorylase family protein